MADIRANRVSDELYDRIQHAIIDRRLKSIKEAAEEAFEMWLAADKRTTSKPPEIKPLTASTLDDTIHDHVVRLLNLREDALWRAAVEVLALIAEAAPSEDGNADATTDALGKTQSALEGARRVAGSAGSGRKGNRRAGEE